MSNDGLDPIRRAYDIPSDEQAVELSDAARAEQDLLSTTKDVLDVWPKPNPPQAVVDAIRDGVAEMALAPLLHAYGKAEGELPEESRALVEFELLSTTKAALDQMPSVSAPSDVLDAVKATAATHTLAPIRKVYEDDAEGVALVAGTPLFAELELLQSTKAAVDQLPKHRPDASVLRAVALAAAPGAPKMRVASDRSPERKRRRLMPALAMAASLAIVTMSGIWVFQQPGVQQQDFAEAQLNALPGEPQPLGEDLAANVLEGEADAFIPGSPTVAPQRAEEFTSTPSQPLVGLQRAAAARRDQRGREQFADNDFGAEDDLVAGGMVAADLQQDTNAPTETVSEWEAGEDVQLLSLRLNQLASSSEGLDWDDSAVPLGSVDSSFSGAAMPGVSAVSSTKPVRANVQVRSNNN